MTKRKQALIVLLTIIIVTLTLLTLDGIFLANKRVRARQLEFSSAKINEQLDGFKIVYFSDVHYNLFVDNKRVEDMVNLINQQKPDMVLFGGDLINDLDTKQLTQEQTSFLIDQLKSINAHYGKFSVSGQEETLSDYAYTTSRNILNIAEFEQIDNRFMNIYYKDSSFNLIGLGDKSDESSVSTLSFDSSKFTLAFSHQPQKADLIKADMMLAGFTHGGQMNVIGFNNVFFEDQPYIKNTQMIDEMRLDISSGVGTDKIDIRMFSDGDILVLTLKQAK